MTGTETIQQSIPAGTTCSVPHTRQRRPLQHQRRVQRQCRFEPCIPLPCNVCRPRPRPSHTSTRPSHRPRPRPSHTATAPPPPTDTAVPTQPPTSTPVPTATPQPTNTPRPVRPPPRPVGPTNTPTPTPTPTLSPPVPHPNPGPTPHPTNTPLPTPTQVPLCADLARYDSRSTDDGGGSELVNPPSILKIDSLKVLMDGTECDNASVFIGGLLRTERYHIVLTTTDGLGFHAQCSARRSTGFTNLEGHRTYRYSFPLWACAGGYPHGTITATVVRAPLGNEVATKTYDVMVAPPPPSGVRSIVHEDGCQIEIVAGTPQVAAGRTPDGGAYAVQTTMYMGVPLSTVVMTGLSKQLPKQYCMVGGIETSAASRPQGDAVHTVVLTRTGTNTRSTRAERTCGYDSVSCGWRLLTARSILFDVTAGDRFDLSSTHEITFGSHSIELETSTFTR